MSAGREQLPPPPPPPNDTVMSPIAPHLLARQGSSSRSASPQLHSTPVEQLQELPPPPPAPASPPATNIPPPPPPPPPFPAVVANGPTTKGSPLVNGDVGKSPLKQIISTSPPKMSPPKGADGGSRKGSQQTPILDPRNDLLKAIRDGKFFRYFKKKVLTMFIKSVSLGKNERSYCKSPPAGCRNGENTKISRDFLWEQHLVSNNILLTFFSFFFTL